MVATLTVGLVVGVISLFASTFFEGSHDFADGACDRLEGYILSELVGQEQAVNQACDAICDHLAAEEPQKPLVLSSHGPPGVGKSLMHLLLARGLYSKQPSARMSCPGRHCLGYKVMYGLDYTAFDQARQHELVREALIEHIRLHPQSLIVIEEYDKLDCKTRGLLKQLLDASHSTNVTLNRSIIMLESNTGYSELHQMVAKGRQKVSLEAAQRVLKDLVFSLWAGQGCESTFDTVKLLSLIDFYLPFFPLERVHIRQLFKARLDAKAEEVLTAKHGQLIWEDEVTEFLVSKVDFEGEYPIEGAKEVRSLMTRYVTRAMRVWSARQSGEAAMVPGASEGGVRTLLLKVAQGGIGLEVIPQ